MKWTAVFLFICAAGRAGAGSIFYVTDLGSLGGAAAQAFGLNASGQAVGSASNLFGYTHAFTSTGNGMIDLTFHTAASEGIASGINAGGQIVGTQFINGQAFATEWINGTPQSIASAGSYATAINDSGQITGMLADGHAFVDSNGSFVELGAFGWSSGYAINSAGEIAGYGQVSPGIFRGFAWTPSTGYVQFGTLGGTNSYAMAINDSGEVAGDAQLANGYVHAAVWSGGVMQDLGTLGLSSFAYGINSAGDVVGTSYDVNGVQHAFLYQNGVMLDLNNLLSPSSSGWVLEAAYAINGSNQIVGTGLLNGVEHAFRLEDPPSSLNSAATAPEPATWVIALIGLALILSSRIRLRPRLPRRQRIPQRELP